MRTSAVLVAGTLVALGLVRAEADDLDSGYFQQEMREVKHRVTVRVDGREAVFRVTRTVENAGDERDEATWSIDLPTGAVATGLRLRSGGRWHDGVLHSDEEAASLYDHFTRGGKGDRGPALLSWEYGGRLALSVYPVLPGKRVTVQYTLRAPLCYVDGHLIADYPKEGTGGDEAPAITAVKRGRDRARLIDGAVLEQTLELNPIDEECAGIGTDSPVDVASRTFIVYPAPIRHGVEARLASYRVDDEHNIVRVEIDAAPQLAPEPKDARLVFAVDASASLRVADVTHQLELVGGYMAHLPDAEFEVVLYRRHAERLFGRWVRGRDASVALAGIDGARVAPGNGSHLDRGLSLAARLLRDHRGATRVVAFTDNLWRSAFEPVMARSALADAPRDTLVHIVETGFGAGEYAWARDDDHDLAAIAHATGGLAVAMNGGDGGARAAAEAMAGLVVPETVDYVTLEGPWDGVELGAPDTLTHGDGFRVTDVREQGAGAVVLRGMIWGRQLVVTARADTAASERLAGLVFGQDVWGELPEQELERVARDGAVVSPATSLFARDPRAGRAHFPDIGMWGTSVGSICGGSCGIHGVGHSSIGTIGKAGHRELIDHVAILRDLLWPRVNACALMHDETAFDVAFAIETTWREVVDVSVSGAASSELAACLEEAAWSITLDDRFRVHRSRWDVPLAWPAR